MSRRKLSRRQWLMLAAALPVVIASSLVFADWWTCLPDSVQARYVGRQSCIDCHQQYYEQWQGSHHDLAMDVATDETVLADFEDVQFENFGIQSRMFRKDGKFFVHTEGPDGKMTDFEVKYVFGYTPLQQYMVEFDRPAEMPDHEIARLQVLRLCWNTVKSEWFYLPPPDVDEKLSPDDDLHWTGIAQRWNNMCADCHSTNLQKSFDVATRTYHTTFTEIDVSCETCHGPGSVHVELAESKSLFWDRKRGYGLPSLKDSAKAQIETCAPCHSRRRVLQPGFLPGEDYYDFFENELLQRNTYHADGQILDEDYVYGSFIQSKMFHKGIRCSDCHDPHSVRLKYEGNQVCTSCHQHPAGKYDGPAHHHHEPDSTGASCVECHMPETTYMEVDPRRDHSLRVPEPDLSVKLGTPNACTRCHLPLELKKNELARDEGAETTGLVPEDRKDLGQYLDWILAGRNGDEEVQTLLTRIDREMEAACLEWYGDKKDDQPRRGKPFAEILDAARRGDPAAEEDLIRLAGDGRESAIVRATAVMELGQFGSRKSLTTAVRLLEDPDPQVRSTAIGNLQGRLPDDRLAPLLIPILDDPVRLVRSEAARVLATVDGSVMRGAQRKRLAAVLEEYERGLMVMNDRAAAHMTLGIMYENLGDEDRAVDAYETAVHVESAVTGPRTNLAAIYDRMAEGAQRRVQQAGLLRDNQAGQAAIQMVARYRELAVKARREELDHLARDARLVPDSGPVQYRYGMSLYLHRKLEEAEQALLKACELEPNNPQFLFGLVLFYKEINQFQKALTRARTLVELRPEDPMYLQVLTEIEELAESANRS